MCTCMRECVLLGSVGQHGSSREMHRELHPSLGRGQGRKVFWPHCKHSQQKGAGSVHSSVLKVAPHHGDVAQDSLHDLP